jgi:hypothetical protein
MHFQSVASTFDATLQNHLDKATPKLRLVNLILEAFFQASIRCRTS